jgi:hypothetical protein
MASESFNVLNFPINSDSTNVLWISKLANFLIRHPHSNCDNKKFCEVYPLGNCDIDFFNFCHHLVWNFKILNQSEWDQNFTVNFWKHRKAKVKVHKVHWNWTKLKWYPLVTVVIWRCFLKSLGNCVKIKTLLIMWSNTSIQIVSFDHYKFLRFFSNTKPRAIFVIKHFNLNYDTFKKYIMRFVNIIPWSLFMIWRCS